MKPLPIGINTLSTIISENMAYVDKTELAYKITLLSGRYFLSRPRRFGKSLFLDTLKEIFEGNKELFKGLYIYDKWNWDKKYPVVKVDFAGGNVRNRADLDLKLNEKFRMIISKYELVIESTTVSGIFNEIIDKLLKKYSSKVVILIDEYDKPLLDNIENPEIAAEVKDGLKDFYSVIKEQDANLQFVFLTGVSKFSKVNIFSGLNSPKDLTLSPEFGSICGYTQNDLETVFAEHLAGVDWDELKKWYNGYNFLGEKVYNPYDLLLFISENQSYRNYWFETGTPTFLIKLFKKNRYFLPDLDNLKVGEEILSSFDLDKLEPVTILFQSGYLTIKDIIFEMDELEFTLTYPNLEVKKSLNKYLIGGYADITADRLHYQKPIYDSLMNADMEQFEKAVNRLFAGIPYTNFTNNDLINYEGYYASVLYAFFSAINCEVIPEDISSRGRADMTIKLGTNVFVMEIKVGKDGDSRINEALEQVQERGYAEKYCGVPGVGVYEMGLIFDPLKRNMVEFEWRKIV